MRYTFLFLLVLMFSDLLSQSTDIPLNSWAYGAFDEWDVKSETGIFTEIKPVSRKYFAEKSLETSWVESAADKFDRTYIQNETWEHQDSAGILEKPLFNQFFKYPADFYAVNSGDFDLHVNPVVVLGVGKDQQGRLDELLFENYRGLELRGTIDNKVSFYTLLTENQARYPDYIKDMTDTTHAVPYEGFWKQYNDTGVDFLRAQAYIDFNVSKHISTQFGYGKHFIGDGRRSLILSDVGNNYPYLRLNTRIWKIQYTNIFAQLVGQTEGGDFGLLGTGSFSQKYLASHHLSIKVKPNLTLGLFESVIYGDSTRGLKVEYLNPIIFYRALEQQDGSSDNVLLGLDFKWNLFQTISLYGQLVIDELIVSEAFSDSGWWGNKQAFQVGLKYFDVLGIDDLNVQVELNRVRPYVYSHVDNYTSYSHYNMALAHPLGANFQEVLLSLNYRPLPKWRVQCDILLAKYGNDLGEESFGRDIMKSYNLRPPNDYGVEMFQGNQTTLNMIHGKVSYHFWHNAMIDLDATLRQETSATADLSNVVLGATLRWNFAARSYLF
ncbi:MAG: hypothetical protein RIC35_03315 [Marinoscillum sp.]